MQEQEKQHIQYDPLLEGIRYEYELDRYLLFEESGNAYDKWKVNALSFMQTNMNRFKRYLQTQANTYDPLLSKYREMIQNNQKYPSRNSMKNSVNYTQALARLNRPVTNGLQGMNLDRVDTGKDSKINNLWLYKQFVPIYDGKKSFSSVAKKYFTGEDTKISLSKEGVNSLLDTAWRYCMNTQGIIKNIDSEARSIINFINNNPINGQQELVSQANNNANNPKNNNVNASYEEFAKYYFNELATTPNAQTSSNVQQSQTGDIVKPVNTLNRNNTSNSNNNKQNQNNKAKDNTAEIYKKKIIVCKILLQCFNAKMTGYGILYKELMDVMKSHIIKHRTK